ncbi:MAG: tRNA (adenosine(37)-N6)-threonylcarbamoyltransferase complex transferase subunit TsaD [Gemmatimonadota bacterium]|nr:tRNA (adenosine(37)-N6)-threonylcarbamoyltransferase complex transferase subunit TsaD [Gemmatimonadota bacterium]MDE3173257.1 tRNA (adenosine(37)-N6)-threonylcarbamoyltransferase complex transferase subunit TsaD [Gemmatimonadota bacterium]MDE3215861.1 tRNA (adenosine(37)-N6)-threonylcarbamoyltransferase complex transferase subunit TsaD [Gemmatimonadota bacterium]
MRVLGIETSCDETSAAVVDGTGDEAALQSLVILSQDVHRVFGGVVPEIASRAHLTSVQPVVARALADAGVPLDSVDAVAVTHGPGLVGALLVGVSFGKALAHALGVPLAGVHHMEGHLFATSLEDRAAAPPFTALLVSGGHTLLLDVEAWGRYRLLGRTRDDAAGEAFDKVAKLLDLPYPGGPHVERLAAAAGPGAGDGLRFTRPMLRRDQRPDDPDYYDFSFSGLKTAVLNAVRAPRDGAPVPRAAVARAFQDALVGSLVEKTARAVVAHGRTRVVLGGGVAGNRALVAAMRDRLAPHGVTVYAPGARLATDNAAMIARAGLFHLERGERAGLDLNAFATLSIPGLIAA